MPRLNQIIAVENGTKSKAEREVTDAYHTLQKTPLLNGIARTYAPKDDDGDRLPSESTLVQIKVADVLTEVAKSFTRLFDVTLAKDTANTEAKGNIVVDGETILADVPVTYLLFLEKKLVDIRTIVSKVPTLDPAEQWVMDTNTGAFATQPTQTVRTKKVPKNWVKAPATDKHPAQVEIFHEDVIVGYWTTVKFSGALPADRVAQVLERIDKLLVAVKFAREDANNMEVNEPPLAGDRVFSFLFA